MSDRFQILSLSGGGYLGLYTVTLLSELEDRLGHPIAQSFDLLAGTSVGGIIALGLANEVPASDIRKAFEKNGHRIFSGRPAPSSKIGIARDLLRFAIKPKYGSESLRETVAEIVGSDLTIGNLKHRVLVPAVNVTKGQVQVFKTPHHPNFKNDLKYKIVDVSLATSAAPTFFPLAELDDCLFADGGLYANSPDMLALHEAQHFLGCDDVASIHVLSVGTTTSRYSFAHADGRKLGAVQWLKDQRLTSVMLAAQQQSVDFMMKHRLQDRYVRLDYDQSKSQERHLALDVATEAAQKTIRGLAKSSAQAAIARDDVNAMLSHRASTPKFFV